MSILENGGNERWHESFATLKVGSKIWQFDINRRHYPTSRDGRQISGPIYERHFEQREIAGETKQSWLVLPYPSFSLDMATKVNKKTLLSSSRDSTGNAWFTDETKNTVVWLHNNRIALANAITNCKNIYILKQVAHLLEHKEITES